MIEVKTIARKWGNSIGVSLPKDVVKKTNIKPNRMITVFIQDKKIDLSKAFGSLKIKKPTQEILDEIREGEKCVFL